MKLPMDMAVEVYTGNLDVQLNHQELCENKRTEHRTSRITHSAMSRNTLAGFIHSILSYLFQLRNHSWPWSTAQSESYVKAKSPLPAPIAFQNVSLGKGSASEHLDRNAEYWWDSSGYALSVLLERAGYTDHAQHKLLDFFLTVIPSLGPRLSSTSPPRWKSFMTDNHVPIELSWDWRTDGEPPKIRFSIEPVGVHAGTHLDPRNQYASAQLRETVARVLPNTDMEWLDHFQSQLNGKAVKDMAETVEGHMSKEFYAFDLNGNGSIMAKAYFFPGFKARATEKSNFDIIRSTISTAPGCSPDKLEALACFQSYVRDPSTPHLEMDMLAIDLVGPVESRFKIYFRIRDTSFASIRNTMTLGGRVQTPEIDQGLGDLRRLYCTLVGAGQGQRQMQMIDENVHTQDKDHRTAGILYNVEFKYGSRSPKVKVYLPVRHFALSEEGIISTLDEHFQQTQRSCSWRTNMRNYREALRTVFSADTLRAHDGLQTYLGCSVKGRAGLRLVSYINPGASQGTGGCGCGEP
ncbi:hypothetical protein KVR01_011124 [Diaporthe batatas]|uniref:uncharacterized protein n=1 Tax=Diaporthe batatas TaxID=748121 RepID=UPI001D03FBE8|nr:uncharacterized protein KVR01_011124 [Diaporthe batatas]KAG8159463.1 hypothetical protein KVR01_011124 [Diaporthe batatas]